MIATVTLSKKKVEMDATWLQVRLLITVVVYDQALAAGLDSAYPQLYCHFGFFASFVLAFRANAYKEPTLC